MVANIINIDCDTIAIIGLIASIITIITFILWIFEKLKILEYLKIKTINYLSPYNILILWLYQHKAFNKGGDSEKAKHFLKYFYLNKLYSKNAIKQNTAIETIVQLNDTQWAFSTFVDRVGNKPNLTPNNKSLILKEIIKLCKKM